MSSRTSPQVEFEDQYPWDISMDISKGVSMGYIHGYIHGYIYGYVSMDISMDRIYLMDISMDISMDVSMDISQVLGHIPLYQKLLPPHYGRVPQLNGHSLSKGVSKGAIIKWIYPRVYPWICIHGYIHG